MTDNEPIEEMFDIGEIRRRLNNEFYEETEHRRIRINDLLRSVKEKLKRGIPVRVTEQMEQYGIADQVRELCMRVEVARRIEALSRDEDDEDNDEAIDFT